MMLYKKLFFFLLMAGSLMASAQNFGGFPSSTKWKQIDTDTARIIFTEGAQNQAARVATLVHRMAEDTGATLGSRMKKINMVLHHNTTLANGYVGLAPFRSEFYMVPSSEIFEFGNMPWHENLAIHEYRHVQQYNNFNHGLAKVFRIFGGDGGQALANALTIPDWFFEGDAVWAETAFSEMGRGRRPYFLSAYNSIWQAGKDYSWMKLRNGSYKDCVPNHYHTGYLLVNYGYGQYGSDFWKKVTRNASAFKGIVYPFQKGIQNFSGKSFKNFRKEAFNHYRQNIQEVAEDKRRKEAVTHYYFPQPIGEDTMVYLKESYRQLPHFFVNADGKENKLKRRNISTENWFDYESGKIAYTAYATHARWSLVDYSNIIIYDIATGNEKQLTAKGKYFTPAFAPGANTLAAVFINDTLGTELHLLNTLDGTVVKKIAPRDGSYFVHPQFVDNEQLVVGIRQKDGIMNLNLLNTVDGGATPLTPPSLHTVGYPSHSGDSIFFTASYNGNDDVYFYELSQKKLFRLTGAQTGSYYPFIQKDHLVWSQFTANGMQLRKRDLKDLTWMEVENIVAHNVTTTYAIAEAKENLLTDSVRHFEVKKYRKSTGLINLHSWDPGLTLYSNNILNTFSTELEYAYNESENSHTAGWNASYGGWFPVINGGIEYTFNREVEQPNRTLTFNTFEARIGYNIPLNLTKGKTLKSLNFGSNYVYNQNHPTGNTKNIVNGFSSHYLHHFAGWAQQLQKARQHIFPKLGYAASVAYRHRIDEEGYQANGQANVYLPSFFINHSIVLTGSFQQTDTGALYFSNRFSLARGYPDYYYSRMWNAGFNYHMPLVYPDWGAASIVYFMRIRSNFYFDYSTVYSKDKAVTSALRSTGAEIYFDTKWWNQLPVTFGVRYSYLLDKEGAQGNRNRFEFIVPIDLVPF